MQSFTLDDFIRESNKIEGIDKVMGHEVLAHQKLLAYPALTVAAIEEFVLIVAHARLREKGGMDVRVGRHMPPRGGPHIKVSLDTLLLVASATSTSPFQVHTEYETLHPFMDGNGRSGRAIWLWQMGGIEFAPLGFLHHFYYQTLAECH